jgi:hypothetical protein
MTYTRYISYFIVSITGFGEYFLLKGLRGKKTSCEQENGGRGDKMVESSGLFLVDPASHHRFY